jgi:hypothetical protein
MESKLAAPSSCTLLSNPRYISKDQVDRNTVHDEPRTAVDPWSPASAGSDRHICERPSTGDLLERGQVDVCFDVQAHINIGIWPMCAARSAAPESDRLHASYRAEFGSKPAKAIMVEHNSDRTPPEMAVPRLSILKSRARGSTAQFGEQA